MSKEFLSGSEAAAHGARLARVDVISAYPISPNTLVLSTLAEMAESGELDAEMVNVEGEHSAGSVCAGAVSAGARAFTVTCGQGMAYMHEVLWMASGMALPLVVAVTNRGVGGPQTLASDLSDSLPERDSAFLQFYCEDAQEVLDSIIMAYKVGENEEVLLPSFVCLEGYRLTHTYEGVEIPEPVEVDRYLPPYNPKHAFFDLNHPIAQGAANIKWFSHTRKQQHEALIKAKTIIKEACAEFKERFGREYGFIESYRMEDAEIAIVSLGTVVSVARDAVERYRAMGKKVGLVKIRCFRPFPDEELREALSGVPKVLVLDRFHSPGSHGVVFTEVRNCLYGSRAKVSNLILGHMDVSQQDIEKMIDMGLERPDEFEDWYNFEVEENILPIVGIKEYESLKCGLPQEREGHEEAIAPGTTACQGCASLLALRQALQAMGDKTVCAFATGCMQAVTAIYPYHAWRIPTGHYLFNNVASAASGIEVALRRQNKDYDILVVGGDGGMVDIGLQALSGAIERGHNLTYLCYDNEAYMNTGVQRSGTTSFMASTKTTPDGKKVKPKDIDRIMEAHGIYVATALPCFPNDLKNKIQKARDINGPAFVHVLTPCPTGWEHDVSKSIEIARLAFETGAWLLFESDNGKRTYNRLPKQRKPIIEYLKLQGRFSHLTEAGIAEIQKEIDERFAAITQA